LQASEVRVALVAAACLLVEAVLAKNVLDVHLDAFSQLAGMWVWLVYVLVGVWRRRTTYLGNTGLGPSR
jgi:hypothetical protein